VITVQTHTLGSIKNLIFNLIKLDIFALVTSCIVLIVNRIDL